MANPFVWQDETNASLDVDGGATTESRVVVAASPDGTFSLTFDRNLAGNFNVPFVGYDPFLGFLTDRPSVASGTVERSSGQAYLENGNLVMAWIGESAPGQYDVFFKISGTSQDEFPPLVAAKLANAGATTGSQQSPAVARMGNGNFAVTWYDVTEDRQKLRTFDQNGNALSAVVTVDPGFVITGSPESYPVIIFGLADGGVAVGYRADGGRLAIFDADGTPRVQDIDTTGTGLALPGICQLANGQIVVVEPLSGTSDVVVRFFSPLGVPQGAETVVTLTGVTADQNFAVRLTALQDGRFMMVSSNFTPGNPSEIWGAVFLSNGTLDGTPFMINDSATGIQTQPSIATLADGRVIVGWQDMDVGNGDAVYKIYDPRESGADLIGTVLDDRYYGTTFGDTLIGGDGADTFDGDDGDDILSGQDGEDTLFGGRGTDFLFGGTGADTLYGGSGLDFAFYTDAAAGVVVSLNNVSNRVIGTGDAAGDQFFSVEGVQGSSHNDYIYGNELDNTISGNDGNDHLYGSWGADYLFGDDGIDYTRYDDASYGDIKVSLANNAAIGTSAAAGDEFYNIEGVVTGGGNDWIYGNNANNYFYGNGGNDHFFGSNGADYIHGGSGLDYVRFDEAGYAGLTADLANTIAKTGAAAGDTYVQVEGLMLTNNGDFGYGDGAANYLYGRGGGDTLDGRDGADFLDGGSGDDTLTGGTGNDTFRFNIGYGRDTVTVFAGGTGIGDKLDLRGCGFANFAAVLSASVQVGANLEVRVNLADVLVLNGFLKGNFAVDDVILV